MLSVKIYYVCDRLAMQEFEADSIEDAAKVTKDFRGYNDIYSGTFAACNVYDGDRYIGQIAYNGRFYGRDSKYSDEFRRPQDVEECGVVSILIFTLDGSVVYARIRLSAPDWKTLLTDPGARLWVGGINIG